MHQLNIIFFSLIIALAIVWSRTGCKKFILVCNRDQQCEKIHDIKTQIDIYTNHVSLIHNGLKSSMVSVYAVNFNDPIRIEPGKGFQFRNHLNLTRLAVSSSKDLLNFIKGDYTMVHMSALGKQKSVVEGSDSRVREYLKTMQELKLGRNEAGLSPIIFTVETESVPERLKSKTTVMNSFRKTDKALEWINKFKDSFCISVIL